jgi:tetratricopeptide (TPR) repeat protein
MNPPDDLAKTRRLIEIDQRYVVAMPDTMPGRASEAAIKSFESIKADYDALIDAGPPSFALYKIEDVMVKSADVTESIARTYDSLRNDAQAAVYYEQAATAYERCGHPDKAQRCRSALAQVKLSAGGDIDDELQRLQAWRDTLDPASLEHAKATVQLGELFSAAGDDFEAERYLREAEASLQQGGFDNPGGGNLADALTQSVSRILSGEHVSGPTDIETQMAVRDLHRRIYLAYAQIYRTSDPDRAAELLKKAEAMDSSDVNQQFSDTMMKSLDSLMNLLDRNRGS